MTVARAIPSHEAEAARIVRASSGVATHVFGPQDGIARDAVAGLVRAFLDANTPYTLHGHAGQGFDVAVAIPSAKEFRGGKFQGSVHGLARLDSGALREFHLPGTELGGTALHAVRRLVTETALSPPSRFRHRDPHIFIHSLRPSRAMRSAPSLSPLASALGGIAEDRLGSSAHLRFPSPATLIKVGDDLVVHLGTSGNVSAHSLATGAAGPLPGPTKAGPGGRLILPEGCRVDWAGYGSAILHPLKGALGTLLLQGTDAAMGAFRDRLDRSILASLREQDDHAVALYQWLWAGGSVHARLNRRQALSTYPILAALTGDAPLTEAIDAALPLPEALAVALKTSVAATRRLGGVHREESGGFGHLVASLPFVTEVDPRHLPTRGAAESLAEQWKGIVQIVSGWRHLATSNALGRTGIDIGIPSRMASEPPVWQRAGGTAKCAAASTATDDFGDMLWMFSRHILHPVVVDALPPGARQFSRLLQHLPHLPCGDGDSPVFETLVRDRSLSELGRISLAWHRKIDVINAELALGKAGESLSWPALSAPFGSHGFSIVALTTPDALSDEGAELRHCVGTYALACLQDGHHILSLRQDGRRVSTAEIRIRTGDGPAELILAQHKAASNGEPPRRARQALSAYMEAVRAGAVAIDFEGLEAARAARVGAGMGDERITGYDLNDPARRDHALSLYAFALPPDERGLSHAEWVERLGLEARMRELLRAELRTPAYLAARGSEFIQALHRPENEGMRREIEAHLSEDAPTPAQP